MNLTPLRWARAISERHAAALKLLTMEDYHAIKDGLRAAEELPLVEARIAKLAEVRAKLDEKAR